MTTDCDDRGRRLTLTDCRLAAATQTAILGRFGQRIGSWPAMAFVSVISAIVPFTLLLITGQGPMELTAALHTPAWMWIGGLLGSFYLFSVTVAAPRIGTTATIGFVIAGQLTMGVLIDQLGLFGFDRIDLSWQRLLGVLVLATGAMLSLRR